jgi:hypothetical protein
MSKDKLHESIMKKIELTTIIALKPIFLCANLFKTTVVRCGLHPFKDEKEQFQFQMNFILFSNLVSLLVLWLHGITNNVINRIVLSVLASLVS